MESSLHCLHIQVSLSSNQERAASDYRLNFRLHEACGKEAKRLCPSACGNLQRELACLSAGPRCCFCYPNGQGSSVL